MQDEVIETSPRRWAFASFFSSDGSLAGKLSAFLIAAQDIDVSGHVVHMTGFWTQRSEGIGSFQRSLGLG
jgi:hypothetical protein